MYARHLRWMDPELRALASAVQSGFESTHNLTDPLIRQYFSARSDIWIQKGILMYKKRIIIPMVLRKKILHTLHSAHQGVEGMRARASITVYWPGLNSSIKQMRSNCNICNKFAPSQARDSGTIPRKATNSTPRATRPARRCGADNDRESGLLGCIPPRS